MNQLATNSLQGQHSSSNWFQIHLKVKYEHSSEQERMQFWQKQLRYSKRCMWSALQTWLITIIWQQQIVCYRQERTDVSFVQPVTQSESWTRTIKGRWAGRKVVLDPPLEADFTLRLNWLGPIGEGNITCKAVRVVLQLQQLRTRDRPPSESIITAAQVDQMKVWSKNLRQVPQVYPTWEASLLLLTTRLDREAFSLEPCQASRHRSWPRCKHRRKRRKATDCSTSKARSRCLKSQWIRLINPSRRNCSKTKGTSNQASLGAVASSLIKNEW